VCAESRHSTKRGAWGAGELCSPRTIAGGHGEAEREGASVASGCGGEGAGPEVPEGGSERGGGGRWGPTGGGNPPRGPILESWGARRLCRRRTIAGGLGTPFGVTVLKLSTAPRCPQYRERRPQSTIRISSRVQRCSEHRSVDHPPAVFPVGTNTKEQQS